MKSYYLLYLPAVIFFLMPLIPALIASAKARRKEKEREAKRVAAEAAKQAAAEARKAKEEARRAAEAAAAQMPKRKRGRPRKNPAPAPAPAPSVPAPTPAPVLASAPAPVGPVPVPVPAPVPASVPAQSAGRKPFAGEVVAFTGTCPKLEKRYMISHVRRLGGYGFEHINNRCTLLVIGEKPGLDSMTKAERWKVKTCTWQEWWIRAFGYEPEPKSPAAMTPDEFTATVA